MKIYGTRGMRNCVMRDLDSTESRAIERRYVRAEISEQLEGGDLNNPCDMGTCEHCYEVGRCPVCEEPNAKCCCAEFYAAGVLIG